MKAAVVGAGTMGSHHARIYAGISDVDFVAIADLDEGARARLAHRHRVRAYADYRVLLDEEEPDLVTVAVPTRLHCQVACEAIRRGVHVLIEKPLALTPDEGRTIVAECARYGVNGMVGHIERFNPAVIEIKRRLGEEELGRVLQVHARRLSPLPGRIADVGVVLDLASHDVDVIRYLISGQVQRVHAELERRSGSEHEDLLSALMRFDSGIIGVLDVNWLSPTKVRQLTVLGEAGMYVADYLTQDLYLYKNNAASETWGALTYLRGVAEGDMVKIHLNKREPIQAEVEEFVASVRDGREPAPTCSEGLATLELTTRLIESGRFGSAVPGGVAGSGAC